ISALFTKIGASASQLFKGPGKTPPIGEFGIGVLSYFLISDRYEVYTRRAEHEPLGLAFPKSMLEGACAEPILAQRSEIGTTVKLPIKSHDLFDKLRQRFSFWFRHVEGLTALEVPNNLQITQGGLTRSVMGI